MTQKKRNQIFIYIFFGFCRVRVPCVMCMRCVQSKCHLLLLYCIYMWILYVRTKKRPKHTRASTRIMEMKERQCVQNRMNKKIRTFLHSHWFCVYDWQMHCEFVCLFRAFDASTRHWSSLPHHIREFLNFHKTYFFFSLINLFIFERKIMQFQNDCYYFPCAYLLVSVVNFRLPSIPFIAIVC